MKNLWGTITDLYGERIRTGIRKKKDGGAYVQRKAVTFTRSIPWEVKWLGPYINSASREFLHNGMADPRTAARTRK
ncbi:MAG: hypothetical protein ABSD20_00070 [Terriglobales bacterium]|jgi:hypothetical protein